MTFGKAVTVATTYAFCLPQAVLYVMQDTVQSLALCG